MIIIEHRLKEVKTCQAIEAQVVGPAPATHLFICTGIIMADAGRVVEQKGFNDISIPEAPLSFIIPGSDRQFLSLIDNNGTPLSIISSTAFVSFTTHNGRHVYKEIKQAHVYQQGAHPVLVIMLAIDIHADAMLSYNVSILAGPAN